MSFDYAKSQATASRLISSFGASVTFTRPKASTYTPGTGYTSYGLEYAASLAVVDYTTGERLDSSLDVGDMKGLFYGSTAPQAGDKVSWGGRTWRVENVKPLSPGGTVVYYELQLRA